MKHLKFLLFAMMAICLNTSVNAQKTKKAVKTTQQTNSTKYGCPMKCEGDKTYAKGGKCPVCNMSLKALPTSATTSYQCPMKCEGDKTYSQAGKCPVCTMDLKGQAVKNEKKKSKEKEPTHNPS
jgi:hypothetical protein